MPLNRDTDHIVYRIGTNLICDATIQVHRHVDEALGIVGWKGRRGHSGMESSARRRELWDGNAGSNARRTARHGEIVYSPLAIVGHSNASIHLIRSPN